MPARVAEGANGVNSSRFSLPALDLNFGSITDGTSIPPPPDSPVEKPVEKLNEKPSKPEAKTVEEAKKPEKSILDTKEAGVNGNLAGTKRPADETPPSPSVSNRPGSLRRLLSRSLLNNSYAEGQESNGNEAASVVNGSRPESRNSLMDDRKSKRSSGWFRRLRGGESKRSSFSFESVSDKSPGVVSKGPPPPMIPELKELEKDEGSLGSDLFKNIK